MQTGVTLGLSNWKENQEKTCAQSLSSKLLSKNIYIGCSYIMNLNKIFMI